MNHARAASHHTDIIIVGAGLSGIGAAYHITTRCSDQRFKILESREAIGGTWDLFQYPGIRSDSDMYTLGYSFKPWISDDAIADGPAILRYIRETAEENDLVKHIQFNSEVKTASWCSAAAQWTLGVINKQSGIIENHTCQFLFLCSGYYDYDQGYMPALKGAENFIGPLFHPQHWPRDLTYENKKVVVIGSGATAVTIVPQLAKKASSVIMLQRTPTYYFSAPKKDGIANFLRKVLPLKMAYFLSRWKNILMGVGSYSFFRKWPQTSKNFLIKIAKKEIGSEKFDHKHFDPPYNPWDQRLCLIPDSDLFKTVKEGKAEIITDHIDHITTKGILLQSGKCIDADIIVCATGLKVKILGGISLDIDGQQYKPSDSYCYRGMMFTDIPNMALSFGYTNASWTLKSDLTAEYVCRLLNYMKKNNLKTCIPRMREIDIRDEPFLDFNSGYILRNNHLLPKQGHRRPWRVFQNYILDIFNFRYHKINDKALDFD